MRRRAVPVKRGRGEEKTRRRKDRAEWTSGNKGKSATGTIDRRIKRDRVTFQ